MLYREQWVIPAAELRIAHHVDYAHQWSEDDRQLFLSAFGNYGKNFGKIRQLVRFGCDREIVNFERR